MGLKVLHFSDLHIGKEYLKIDDFIANIELALRYEKLGLNSVDVIVITGDIFDGSVFSSEN